jgi:tetratricopeptide (TPR) repeat protein
MDSETSLLRQLENPNLSRDQRAELHCQIAKGHEDTGDYEAARQAMGELWQRIGERPQVEGLERSTAGEVFLRAGVLTGYLGSTQQIEDAQETAKNLLSESLSIFESLSYGKKIAEAQVELALCYWREGAYREARDILKEALSRLSTDSELKARAVLRTAMVEWDAARHQDALRILIDNAPLFEKIRSHTLKGSYHNNLANLWENLGKSENREEYTDRAFVEYAAASFHFEQANHKRYLANVENNLGFLFFKIGKYKQAHRHLDHAHRVTVSLKDRVRMARITETRARVFLAERRYTQAEKVARAAVRLLENGGHQAVLAEALITHGKALARLGYPDQSYSALIRAVDVSRQSGAINKAGEAALTIIEELSNHLTLQRVQDTYAGSGLVEVRRCEHDLVKQALISAKGSITQAARILGTSHQNLAHLIEYRHTDLLSLRTPAKPRRKRQK